MQSYGKSIFASKTLWFNALTGGLAILQALSVVGLISQSYLAIGMAIGNALLRLVTTEPIIARN